MLLLTISLDLYAEEENLRTFFEKIKGVAFVEEGIIDGCLSIENPERIGVEYELDAFMQWYVSFLEKYYEEMASLSIREMNLFFNVFYSEQCNFEIFGREMMQKLGRFPLAYPVSVYQTHPDELERIKILKTINGR